MNGKEKELKDKRRKKRAITSVSIMDREELEAHVWPLHSILEKLRVQMRREQLQRLRKLPQWSGWTLAATGGESAPTWDTVGE